MKLICLNFKLHFCVLCQIDCNKTKNCHVVTLRSLLHGTQYWVQIRVRVKKGPWSEWSSSQTGVTLESGSLQINSEWHNQLFQHLLFFRLFSFKLSFLQACKCPALSVLLCGVLAHAQADNLWTFSLFNGPSFQMENKCCLWRAIILCFAFQPPLDALIHWQTYPGIANPLN